MTNATLDWVSSWRTGHLAIGFCHMPQVVHHVSSSTIIWLRCVLVAGSIGECKQWRVERGWAAERRHCLAEQPSELIIVIEITIDTRLLVRAHIRYVMGTEMKYAAKTKETASIKPPKKKRQYQQKPSGNETSVANKALKRCANKIPLVRATMWQYEYT